MFSFKKLYIQVLYKPLSLMKSCISNGIWLVKINLEIYLSEKVPNETSEHKCCYHTL